MSTGASSIESRAIPVKEICSKRNWYRVNREYQREEDIWSGEDKKYLIDSILKGYDIPKIYLRELPDAMFEIVDGQQRIDTIWKFRDDKITLSGQITGKEFEGKQYSDLRDEVRRRFDDYTLDAVILKNHDDERVRELFTRLQRGKPLNPAERLNAFAGPIVPAMRSLGSHSFFKLVNFGLKRYHSYLIAARLMSLQFGLEHYGNFGDIGPESLYNFFRQNKDLDQTSREVEAVRANLDYMQRAFTGKSGGGQVPELSSDVWIVNLYMLVSILRKQYAVRGKEDDLVDFYIKFQREAEGVRRMRIKPVLNTISNEFIIANSSGTGGQDRLATRKKELLTNFLSQVKGIELLDTNRQFDSYEKTVIYARGNEKCARCGRHVSWSEYEADHVRAWVQGGKTTLDNAQLLCSDCNREKGAT